MISVAISFVGANVGVFPCFAALGLSGTTAAVTPFKTRRAAFAAEQRLSAKLRGRNAARATASETRVRLATRDASFLLAIARASNAPQVVKTCYAAPRRA